MRARHPCHAAIISEKRPFRLPLAPPPAACSAVFAQMRDREYELLQRQRALLAEEGRLPRPVDLEAEFDRDTDAASSAEGGGASWYELRSRRLWDAPPPPPPPPQPADIDAELDLMAAADPEGGEEDMAGEPWAAASRSTVLVNTIALQP